MAVLMIDLDHFKAYNDTYGHQRGDDCLRRVAREIHKVAQRPLDVAARYGGEEFGVVLYDADPEIATRMAKRIHSAVEELAIEHLGSPFGRVTPSIGVAVTIPELGQDPADLVAQADSALYLAKQGGRNRVCFFTGQSDETPSGVLRAQRSAP
jgi:diguanylate cyclase (GGDEF)-like protein